MVKQQHPKGGRSGEAGKGMLNGLDLFSGIGGLTLALSPWAQPVAYCEIERYASAVLLSRMSEGKLPMAPIWDNVTTLKGSNLPEIDIIYGGFPCQDVSSAGLRKGMEGERTILYLEAIRLVRECKPKFVFLENVQGIRKFVPSIRGELEALGYDCRDGFLSASEIGAIHIRNRWWLLAYSNGSLQSGYASEQEKKLSKFGSSLKDKVKDSFRESDAPKPLLCRMDHGLSNRAHRYKGLGNAVCPIQARKAFEILSGLITSNQDKESANAGEVTILPNR